MTATPKLTVDCCSRQAQELEMVLILDRLDVAHRQWARRVAGQIS
jgi:hypothetical protein